MRWIVTTVPSAAPSGVPSDVIPLPVSGALAGPGGLPASLVEVAGAGDGVEQAKMGEQSAAPRAVTLKRSSARIFAIPGERTPSRPVFPPLTCAGLIAPARSLVQALSLID